MCNRSYFKQLCVQKVGNKYVEKKKIKIKNTVLLEVLVLMNQNITRTF